ncbi:putative nucleotidyltransferase, ribonuclease H [Tanacetum coccineum]
MVGFVAAADLDDHHLMVVVSHRNPPPCCHYQRTPFWCKQQPGRTLVAAEVVAFGGGDDGEEMMMMAFGGVGWQQWWYKWSGEAVGVTGWRWWRHGSRLWWRVVARVLVGRIDPEMRIILGVGRKNSPENYSGGRRAAAMAGEGWPAVAGYYREAVLTEAHNSPFSIHPGSTKMYRDLKHNFWWNGVFDVLGLERESILSPDSIGPFEILDRVGEVSYRLALPPQLSHVHNVFYVSLLRGYNYHLYHVVQYPFKKIREDLSFAEEPEAILDRQERVMRKKTIPLIKFLWKNHPSREATWENEEMMRTDYPHFFSRFGTFSFKFRH